MMRTALRCPFVFSPPASPASWHFRLDPSDQIVVNNGTYGFPRFAGSIGGFTVWLRNDSLTENLIVPAYTDEPVQWFGPGSGSNPDFVSSPFPGYNLSPEEEVIFMQVACLNEQDSSYDGTQTVIAELSGPAPFNLRLTVQIDFTWFV